MSEHRGILRAVTFETIFPSAKKHDDPHVLEKLRRQAVAVLYAALKGVVIEKERLQAAQFVVGKMVANETPKNVQVNFIQWGEVMRSIQKAGLSLPILDVETKDVSDGGEPE